MARKHDFDEAAFAAALQNLRLTWREACAPRPSANPYLGDVAHAGRSADPSRIDISHPLALPPKSNHDKLHTDAWQDRVRAEFRELLRILQTVPAFDTPRFSVKILFHARARSTAAKPQLPHFKLQIQQSWLTTDFVTVSREITARLRGICRDIACLPRPRCPQDFSIDTVIWQADTPEHAARLYAAIARPSLIGDRTPLPGAQLPTVTQIHDHDRIMTSLRQS